MDTCGSLPLPLPVAHAQCIVSVHGLFGRPLIAHANGPSLSPRQPLQLTGAGGAARFARRATPRCARCQAQASGWRQAGQPCRRGRRHASLCRCWQGDRRLCNHVHQPPDGSSGRQRQQGGRHAQAGPGAAGQRRCAPLGRRGLLCAVHERWLPPEPAPWLPVPAGWRLLRARLLANLLHPFLLAGKGKDKGKGKMQQSIFGFLKPKAQQAQQDPSPGSKENQAGGQEAPAAKQAQQAQQEDPIEILD